MKSVIRITLTCLLVLTFLGRAQGQTTRPAASTQPAYQPTYQANNDRMNRRQRRLLAQERGLRISVPTTQADDTPAPRPMSGNYLILEVRSIFYKGRFVPVSEEASGGGRFTPPPESLLVFVGVTKTDGALAAYLEDTSSGDIRIVRVGNQIAQGKIVSITLDALEYQSGLRVLRLAVGQNLAGDQVYGGEPEAATLPANVDLSGPDADILRKMMLRRQQELNGGK